MKESHLTAAGPRMLAQEHGAHHGDRFGVCCVGFGNWRLGQREGDGADRHLG